MKTIISRSNPDIQFVTSLHKEKNRTQHKLYIAEGIRTCETLIVSGNIPKRLYVIESLLQEAQRLIADAYITVVTEPVMEKISTTKTPSGLLGLFYIPSQVSIAKVTSGLILAGISDPGNMGTLIRSCAAMNCSSVIIVGGTDPWSPKVVQASAGTIGKVSIIQDNWDSVVKNKRNYTLCALVVSGGKMPDQINFANALLIVGNEAHGIPDAWLADCDVTLTIPMPGQTESLNAAVAGSIALYVASMQGHSIKS